MSKTPDEPHERGTWEAARDLLSELELDPAFVERYEALASHPMDGPLDEKTAELVALASHAACTTVYEPEMRRYVGRALDAGASVQEVLGTLEFVSAIGIHAVTEGVPVLVDETSLPTDVDDAEREKQAELRDRFESKRGYWDELWDQVVQIDSEYFEAYLEFSSHPTEAGLLTPLQREFVVIAADASANHMYLPGLRIHIKKALDYGGTREEIMAVMEIASAIGANTVSAGLPILVEEARARDLLD
ncbi:carboxymuconolactone decarboxylase family protein [Haloferax sp. YSSS75]|uniref:carboxymuconolactone decarboxylase family protein n=1 Tax=Haloferax sp. YSSS75 TaxID=3388564 RepID=UPI00398D0437